MAIRVKHGGSLDAAERRAQKQADRTGKPVEIHFQRESHQGNTYGRQKYYWAYYTTIHPSRSNAAKRPKKGKLSPRVPKAMANWLKQQNPGKMRGVTNVRVKKLKGGGVTITPVK